MPIETLVANTHTILGITPRCDGGSEVINKKHLKNVGPIRRTPKFYIAVHQVSLLSHAACASMSTTTTTTTTRGPTSAVSPRAGLVLGSE